MDRERSRTRPESEICETPDRWPWFISYKVVAFLESVRSYVNRHETAIVFYEEKHTREEKVLSAQLARLEDRISALESKK